MKTLENIQDLKKLLLNPYTIYTYDYAGGFIINDTIDYIEIYEIEIEDEPFDEFLDNIITQYTCYYNAIKRWESNHKETEILHQLEISNLLEQLKNN